MLGVRGAMLPLPSLAAMGYITPEYFKWPGYLSPALGIQFADVPNGLAVRGSACLAGRCRLEVMTTCDPSTYRTEAGKDPNSRVRTGTAADT